MGNCTQYILISAGPAVQGKLSSEGIAGKVIRKGKGENVENICFLHPSSTKHRTCQRYVKLDIHNFVILCA